MANCLLAAYAVGMSGGQVLFKLAALRAGAAGGLWERLLGLAFNAYFIGVLILYGGFAILWVWIFDLMASVAQVMASRNGRRSG